MGWDGLQWAGDGAAPLLRCGEVKSGVSQVGQVWLWLGMHGLGG